MGRRKRQPRGTATTKSKLRTPGSWHRGSMFQPTVQSQPSMIRPGQRLIRSFLLSILALIWSGCTTEYEACRLMSEATGKCAGTCTTRQRTECKTHCFRISISRIPLSSSLCGKGAQSCMTWVMMALRPNDLALDTGLGPIRNHSSGFGYR